MNVVGKILGSLLLGPIGLLLGAVVGLLVGVFIIGIALFIVVIMLFVALLCATLVPLAGLAGGIFVPWD